MILITDITKDANGHIVCFSYLESNGGSAFNNICTKQQLQNWLDKYEHVIYRYINLEKLASEPSPFPAMEAFMDIDATNKPLSLNRGDKVTYSEEEDKIVVNVLEEGYERLLISKTTNNTDIIVKDIIFDGTPNLKVDGLTPGSYKASLVNAEGHRSDEIYFEILQTNVTCKSLSPQKLKICFSSMNAVAEYVVFCTKDGKKHFIDDITEDEKKVGYKLIECKASPNNLFLKVFFKGEYGRVSNHIIPLKHNFYLRKK